MIFNLTSSNYYFYWKNFYIYFFAIIFQAWQIIGLVALIKSYYLSFLKFFNFIKEVDNFHKIIV